MFFKKLFKKKEPAAFTAEEFWQWFVSKEKGFYAALKKSDDNAEAVLDALLDKVQQYHARLFGLIGFCSDEVVELIITTDGSVKDFAFALALVNKSPALARWKFTYLKPGSGSDDFETVWEGFKISDAGLWFYPDPEQGYEDEVVLNLVYEQYINAADRSTILGGLLIYLDCRLGELDMATRIDHLNMVMKAEIPVGTELIPVSKLGSYLTWREKEFTQKYDQPVQLPPAVDERSMLKAEMNGLPFFAVIDTRWKSWAGRPVYAWCTNIVIAYQGNAQKLPDKKQLLSIQEFDSGLCEAIKHMDVCYVGRVTGDNESNIYLYSNEYLQVSETVHAFIQKYSAALSIDYFISKDKYWRRVSNYLR